MLNKVSDTDMAKVKEQQESLVLGQVPYNQKAMRLWMLWYFKGTSQPQFKCFQFEGTMRDAVQRGRLHCTKMNYRFGSVRPFMIDLDYQEEQFEKSMKEFEED